LKAHHLLWIAALSLAPLAPAQTPGTVIFSRDNTPTEKPSPNPNQATITPDVTDAERHAIRVTAYDLNLHLTPAKSFLAARANLTVKNISTTPLHRLVLSISSTLQWESLRTGPQDLAFAQHPVETDIDHTGYVSEAVVTLPSALAPGASIDLTALYSGPIQRSSVRLDRMGAPADQAEWADWDQIAPDETDLRGFGQVLWYPVAAAPVFLGDGDRFAHAVGRDRLLGPTTTAALRLAVEYIGEPPKSAFFAGRLARLTALSENPNIPVEESPGIATAEFPPQPLNFRTLSLFVTSQPELSDDTGALTAITEQDEAFKDYTAAAALVQPLLQDWFGATGPLEPLRLIDHTGQSFEDGPLLVLPMHPVDQPARLAPAMAEALTHVWVHPTQRWIEQGLAQFMYLLWIERTSGRDAAVKELRAESSALAQAETTPTQPLPEASDELYLRNKSAAVLWMLRDLAGDDALKQAIRAYRLEPSDDPQTLERILEQKKGSSLAWFFDDWVYADKGLPDLSIVAVTPSELPLRGGKAQGWLVAVEVHNDGNAATEVPVTVRSGALTTTEQLRVPAHANATTRVLFQKTPEEVIVNNGEIPEMQTSEHTRRLKITPQ
jgi:hypothetical protein